MTNLLIVEDDAGYADALHAELGAFDHRIAVARDGPTALGRDDFDAVLLDRMLPKMDGTTVVRRLRECGHRPPVLMLSALGRSTEKIDGLEAGATITSSSRRPRPSLLVRRRIADIRATAEAIIDGGMTRRVPSTGTAASSPGRP